MTPEQIAALLESGITCPHWFAVDMIPLFTEAERSALVKAVNQSPAKP